MCVAVMAMAFVSCDGSANGSGSNDSTANAGDQANVSYAFKNKGMSATSATGKNFMVFDWESGIEEFPFQVEMNGDKATITLEVELTRTETQPEGELNPTATISGSGDNEDLKVELTGDKAFAMEKVAAANGEKIKFTYKGETDKATVDKINGQECYLSLTW